MPRRKNDPAKVESVGESENKRPKTDDSEIDIKEKDDSKKQDTKADLMVGCYGYCFFHSHP